MSIFGGTINSTEVTKASYLTVYTPTIKGVGGAVTTSAVMGRYMQLGKLVFVEIFFQLSTVAAGVHSVTATLPFQIDIENVVDPLNPSAMSLNTLSGWYTVGGYTPPGMVCYGQITKPNKVTVVPFTGNTTMIAGNAVSLSGWYTKR